MIESETIINYWKEQALLKRLACKHQNVITWTDEYGMICSDCDQVLHHISDIQIEKLKGNKEMSS